MIISANSIDSSDDADDLLTLDQKVVDISRHDSSQGSNKYIPVERNEVASFYDTYLFGIGVVICGQITSWNNGLTFGFWDFFISTTIATVGYGFLCLCLAELTGALPFSGGVYGFARVSLGPYLGYLVGVSESFEFIFYTSTSVALTSAMFQTLFSIPDNMIPLVWLMFYAICLIIHMRGGIFVHRVMNVIVIITIIFIILFCTATIPNMNFKTYVVPIGRDTIPFMDSGISGFLFNFPIAAWFYVGMEAIPLFGKDVIGSSKSVPKAIIFSFVTLVILTYAIIFAVSSQYPGLNSIDGQYELSMAPLPFSYGFSKSFNISMNLASIFSFPGLFLGIYSSLIPFGKQMVSVAQSGLLPIQFTYTYRDNHVPYFALVFGCFNGYIVMLFFWFFDQNASSVLLNACNLGAFSVYSAVFLCYIVFASKYDHLERPFRNPLGIASAVMGLLIFLLLIVSVAFFQRDNYYALIVYVSYIFLMTLYYYFIACERQCFSPEEEKIMFKLYVLKSKVRV